MREHIPLRGRRKRPQYDDLIDEPTFVKFYDNSSDGASESDDDPDRPEQGDRWSTWDQSSPLERGPLPHPEWVITELAAVDVERGVLKTGKEADVFLLSREVPGTSRRTLLAAKRYRSHDHRMFHRDAGYLEGRRDKMSRVNRAMASRSAFGKEAIAFRWAAAEFAVLRQLWEACRQFGVEPFVPYPVQITGTELLMEFIGDADGVAAPRLAQIRAEPAVLADLWEQLVLALRVLARAGYTHGDLSPYNLLVQDWPDEMGQQRPRLVVIDLPQIVDLVANPQGPKFLQRDVHNVAAWFRSQGLPDVDEAELVTDLLAEAGMR